MNKQFNKKVYSFSISYLYYDTIIQSRFSDFSSKKKYQSELKGGLELEFLIPVKKEKSKASYY